MNLLLVLIVRGRGLLCLLYSQLSNLASKQDQTLDPVHWPMTIIGIFVPRSKVGNGASIRHVAMIGGMFSRRQGWVKKHDRALPPPQSTSRLARSI
jgi:hypothetical protein